MIFTQQEAQQNRFSFQFSAEASPDHAQIDSIGIDLHSSTDFRFDGLKQPEKGRYLFLYTLAGWGTYIYKDIVFKVPQGHAVLAAIPGENLCFLPQKSNSWKFIYIMLYGSEMKDNWYELINYTSSVIKYSLDSPVIKTLFDIYNMASEHMISDEQQGIILSQRFLTDLYSSSRKIKEPEPCALVSQVLEYMNANYDKYIGIEDISLELGVSKSHLIRQFTRELGIPPGKHLMQIRMEKAVHQLSKTNFSIEEISRQVGYTNGNYFCKVFKSYLGISPGDFRQKNCTS